MERGKHHTSEAKQKIREAQFGKTDVSRTDLFCDSDQIAYIHLTKGLYAIIDLEDYSRVSKYLWVAHKNRNMFYARRAISRENGKQRDEKMHHLVFGTPPEGMMIDHINGNGLDNRKANLRFVTNRQNCMNRHQKKSSQYPGVTRNKRSGVWNAQAQVNGKHKHIGTYCTEIEAYNAYLAFVQPLEQKLLEGSK